MRRATAVTAGLAALSCAAAVVLPATAAEPGPAVVYQQDSTGPAVNQLQRALQTLGYYTYYRTSEHFGIYTTAGVGAYQRAHGLPVTGTVTGELFTAIVAAAAQLAGQRTPTADAAWQDCTPTLDGIRIRVDRTKRTQTVVNGIGGSYATVSFFARTDSACGFKRIFAGTGRVGYGGITDGATRRQGTGTTPTGTYTMTEAFGLADAPATAMPYRLVRPGDWWVEDNDSAFYNSYRTEAEGGFPLTTAGDHGSERLTDFGTQYARAVVINFNRAPDAKVANRGAGIFLHVNGSGATAGCVSVGRSRMDTVLSYLKPGDQITIVR